MATNLISASLTTPGRSTTRTLGARFGEVVNVKDFGAVGNGSTDDRAAIQAALDYAYGSSSSPHGESNKLLNKPVYFPAGNYRVASSLFITSTRCAHLYGDGKWISMITGDGQAFGTNGCAHSVFERMSFRNGGGVTTAFHLDWNGSGSVSLNANSFYDVGFDGGTTGNGCEVGASGNMGSENLFVNCDFANCVYGLRTLNQNALDQTVIGGSAFNCSGAAFIPQLGSILSIVDVGFAGNGYDIKFGQPQNMVVQGCRSESTHFMHGAVDITTLIGVEHLGSGHFLESINGAVVCIACNTSGDVVGGSASTDLLLFYSSVGDLYSNASFTGRFYDPRSAPKHLTSIPWSYDPIPPKYHGKTITNFGANGDLTTNFSQTTGYSVTVEVVEAHNIRVSANEASTVFRAGALTSTANGWIQSSTPGSRITLERVSSTVVLGTEIIGTWAVST